MARVHADRVYQTTSSTGTGPILLTGVAVGFQAFSAVAQEGDTFDYSMFDIDANGNPTRDWETGVGTYGAGNTISRTAQESSNSGALVDFQLGTKAIVLTETAATVAALEINAGIGSGTGGTGDYVKHRAWRVRFVDTNSNPIPGLATLQFHSSVGGFDVSSGGTPIADSGNPALAFDSDDGTSWEAANGVPAYIGYDFGTNPTAVLEVEIASDHDFPNRTFSNAFVESSDDLNTWTTRWEITNQVNWTANVHRKFTNPNPEVATTPPTGGGTGSGSLTQLAQTTLTADGPTFDFPSLPQTYRDLIVVISGKITGADADVGMRFNGDATGNYLNGYTNQYGSASTASSTYVTLASGTSFVVSGESKVFGYRDLIPRVSSVSSQYVSSSAVFGIYGGGAWKNSVDPITDISVFVAGSANFAAGTTVTVYGRGS